MCLCPLCCTHPVSFSAVGFLSSAQITGSNKYNTFITMQIMIIRCNAIQYGLAISIYTFVVKLYHFFGYTPSTILITSLEILREAALCNRSNDAAISLHSAARPPTTSTGCGEKRFAALHCANKIIALDEASATGCYISLEHLSTRVTFNLISICALMVLLVFG